MGSIGLLNNYLYMFIKEYFPDATVVSVMDSLTKLFMANVSIEDIMMLKELFAIEHDDFPKKKARMTHDAVLVHGVVVGYVLEIIVTL